MERLPRKRNRPQRVGSGRVALFADQRVPAQPRLDADLIALPVTRRTSTATRRQRLDDAVVADRFLAVRIARVGLLNQRTSSQTR